MSIDLARIYPRLTEAVRTRNLVPLLGAGISKHATGHEPHAFPNWSDLIQELARRAEDMKSIGEGSSQEIDRLVMQGKHLMAAQGLDRNARVCGLGGSLCRRASVSGMQECDGRTRHSPFRGDRTALSRTYRLTKIGHFCTLFCTLGGGMMWSIQTKERGVPMKTKFAQIVYFASNIDRRHLQFAYFALTLFALFVIQGPSEGGIGPTR